MEEHLPIQGKIERVLINKKGTAVTPARAEELGIKVDIIFIRDDNYVLGAPKNLSDEACKLWRDDWTHFYNPKEGIIRPIGEYTLYF